MKNLKRVSRWITIRNEPITKRHSLWYYAEKDPAFSDECAYCSMFRWNGRMYAVNQFLSRYGLYGFDQKCEEYPAFICGYDAENYYHPLLCEIDDCGERIRLYVET